MIQSRLGKVNGGNKNRIKEVGEKGTDVKKEEMKELYTKHSKELLIRSPQI